jgi:hypothetical protein
LDSDERKTIGLQLGRTFKDKQLAGRSKLKYPNFRVIHQARPSMCSWTYPMPLAANEDNGYNKLNIYVMKRCEMQFTYKVKLEEYFKCKIDNSKMILRNKCEIPYEKNLALPPNRFKTAKISCLLHIRVMQGPRIIT